MSKYKYWQNGSYYYLMDLKNSQIKMFNSVGSYVDDGAVSSITPTSLDVELISLIDRGDKLSTEVFFQDQVAVINKQYLQLVSQLRNNIRYLGTMFFIKHEDLEGKIYTQVIFACNQSNINKQTLSNLLEINTSAWKNIVNS